MSAIMAIPVCESHLEVSAETIKGGEVEPQRNVCRWVKRPQAEGAGWGRAVLAINGTEYAASSFYTGNDEGAYWQIVDLRKVNGGDHYRLTFGPDGDHCDCPHATYRGCICKHVAAVRAALNRLEEIERDEAELVAIEGRLSRSNDPFEG